MYVLDAENINIKIIFHIHRGFLEFLGWTHGYELIFTFTNLFVCIKWILSLINIFRIKGRKVPNSEQK